MYLATKKTKECIMIVVRNVYKTTVTDIIVTIKILKMPKVKDKLDYSSFLLAFGVVKYISKDQMMSIHVLSMIIMWPPFSYRICHASPMFPSLFY